MNDVLECVLEWHCVQEFDSVYADGFHFILASKEEHMNLKA